MAATYTRVPRSVPTHQRTAMITDVVATDEIDFTDVLGRPARQVLFILEADTDEIQYRLIWPVPTRHLTSPTKPLNSVVASSGVSDQYAEVGEQEVPSSTFSNKGISFLTVAGLAIHKISIDALVGPASITLVCW